MSLGREQWGLLLCINAGKYKVNVWLQRVSQSGCLYKNNRWRVFIMLLLQRFCAEQVSTTCFSNSLPLQCIFYFVVCLVSFWLPQDVQGSEVNYITCNSPSSQLIELLLKITQDGFTAILLSPQTCFVFKIIFQFIYIFFLIKNIYSHIFTF